MGKMTFFCKLALKKCKNYRDFKRDRRIKRQNEKIASWVKMTDKVFRLLEFRQGFISDRRVVAPRESKRFSVIKFIGEIRRNRANM